VRDLLGDKGTVELTGLIGYYSLLAMQLNVFRVEPPEGTAISWWRGFSGVSAYGTKLAI